jgi:hypothetical protein
VRTAPEAFDIRKTLTELSLIGDVEDISYDPVLRELVFTSNRA